MNPLHVFSPAKINLFLAITGQRKDGFHNLLSVAAPLTWGDTLHATPAEQISLTCTDPGLPVDEDNLVQQAATAYRAATGWPGGANLRLEKNIPVGAGLGGGSSNAVATLKVLNALAGNLMTLPELSKVAISLGADCALFVGAVPVVMRGRGEIVENLSATEHARFQNRRVLIFKPSFGVSTPWAYQKMRENSQLYLDSTDAESRLERWRSGVAKGDNALLINNMQPVVYAKYPSLPALHDILLQRFGLSSLMSGSGSASFAFLNEDTPIEPIESCIREAWGQTALVMTTRIV